MKYVHHEVAQRSPEWMALRVGKLTSSAANDLLTTIKSGESAARKNLRIRLALERLTGKSQETGYVSPAMQWGIDNEEAALREYEARTGQIVEAVGFCDLPEMWAGCSPDSFVYGSKGTVSVKCPNSATHYEFLKSRKIPTEYVRQNLHEMWVLGTEFVDFVSYDPRFEERLQYLCVRHERRQSEIDAYNDTALAFLAEVTIDINDMRNLKV